MPIDISAVKWDDESVNKPSEPIKTDEIKWDGADTKESKQPKQTPATLPVEAPPAPKIDAPVHKDKPFWKEAWESAKKGAKEVWNMIAPGVDNVVNVVSPVDVEIDKGQENLRTKINRAVNPQDDVSFETYKKIGHLAKTAAGLGKATKADIDTYNHNLGKLLVDDMGYEDFGIDEHGKYYVTKDGRDIPLDKSTIKTVLADTIGDAGELVGGMAGAKKGYGLGKPLGWRGKAIGTVVGGAIGAMGGNAYDQLVSAVETGEQLTLKQRLDEMNKAAALNVVGDIGGQAIARSASLAAKPFQKAYALATGKKLSERVAEQFAKSASELPEREQQDVLDALLFAQDSGIDLTTSSVVQNPQVDQFVQVVARNPFIRKAIKGTEAKNRDKLVENIYQIIDSKGAKATPEELDAVLKQELKEAKEIRRAETDAAYEAFRVSDTGAYKAKKDGLLKDLDERAKEWGYREKDPDTKELINPDLDKVVNRVKKYINYYSKEDGHLGASELDALNSKIYKMMDAAKDPATRKMLGETRDQVFDHIAVLAEKSGDEVAQKLRKAKNLYKQKENIYGINSKHPDIKRALESHQANEEIHKLLTGPNALDNANILRQELSRTKHGKELLGALGRKHIDDALSKADLASPTALAKALGGDNIEVAKRLLGEEAGTKLGHIQKLLAMMGKTETLLKGTGAPINNGPSKSGIFEDAWNAVKKYTAYYGEHRYMSKVLTSNIAQKAFTKALQKAVKATSKKDVKSIKSLLRLSAKATAKKYNVNMDDIVDMQASKKEQALLARKRRREALLAKREERKAQRAIEKEVKKFTTPDTYEIQAVERLHRGDDKFRTFARTIRRIQDQEATPAEIKSYLQAKKEIGTEALEEMQTRLKQETLKAQEEALKRKEQNELEALFAKKNLTDEELERLNELDQKYNKPLFAGGAVAGAGTITAGHNKEETNAETKDANHNTGDIPVRFPSAADRVDRRDDSIHRTKGRRGGDTGRVAYIGRDGKGEITMHNNAILKDGKLTKEELVSLIEHAPDFEKQLATFGDVKSEGKEKVMNRLLSVFNEEDPVTALAMVAENFYNGDDKKFMKTIQDKKIDSISDTWVQNILNSDTDRKRVETPTTDMFDRMNAKTFKYLDLDAIEGTTFTDDDGRGRTAWGGVDKEYSPKEFAMLQRGEIDPSDANSRVMAREAEVTYKKLPWLKNAKQITQEIASILAMNVGGTGATKFAPTYKLIEEGNIDEAIRHIKNSRLTVNHKRHIIRALREYEKEA